MKILLWKIGALGDVIMTTPLVRQLRRAQPGATIDYLTGHGCVSVLEGNPHIDRVRSFDASVLYGAQVGRLRELRPLLRGYDCIFTLDKHWIFALLARLARVPMRVGFRRRAHEGLLLTRTVRYGALRHEIDYYLDLADAAGLTVDRSDVAIEFAGEDPFDLALGTTVLINSGGANAFEASQVRRMPDALFADLVRACAQQGPVAFLGAASEARYYDRFASAGCLNLCGRTTIPQAASVLRQAERVITTDTGLMHLAAAVNGNVTAVFGPTHPARKCPPGANWAWADDGQYDERYELFGRVPQDRYFGSLTVADILATPIPPQRAARGSEPASWHS
jgi:ADP-heptose:LPS heptosyltransferase